MNTNFNTEKAWSVLHSRLEEDRLLPVEGKKSGSRTFFYQRVAAIALLVLVSAGMLYWWVPIFHGSDWVAQKNNEGSNTLVMLLQDGSIAYLGGHATLSYPEKFESDKRTVKVDGNVFLDIHREPDRPFYVETEHVTVEVLGTAFRIQSPKQQSLFELSVHRGRVKVTQRSTGKEMIVVAGETARLQSGLWKKESGKPQVFDHSGETIRFKDERLENIVRVINTYTDRPIVLESGLENRMLTVTFDEHSADSMAKLICLALQLNYKDQQGSIYISH